MLTHSQNSDHGRAVELAKTVLSPAQTDYLGEPTNPGYWREYFIQLKNVGEVYIASNKLQQGCAYLLESESLAVQFDNEVGLSDTERAGTFEAIRQQASACRNGTIASLVNEN